MSVLDKFLNAMKLNDDDENTDEDRYLDDDVRDFDDEEDEPADRRVIRNRSEEEDDDGEEDERASEERNAFTGSRQSRERYRSAERRDTFASERDRSSSGTRSRNSSSGSSGKVSPIRGARRPKGDGMEVCVIRPHSMEDAREITETLLANCTVILNVEGLELETAQRIIDFASGSCFAIDGNLQKISSYIFIITPSTVDISGDFQDLVSGAFDVPFEKRYS